MQIAVVDPVTVVAMAQRDQVFGIVGSVLGTKDDVMCFELPACCAAGCLASPFVAFENVPVLRAARGIDAFPFLYGVACKEECGGPGGERAVELLNARDRGVPLFNE